MVTRIKTSAKPVFVDRKDALVAEERFFERLRNNLHALQGIFNPLDGRTYDASARNRIEKSLDVRTAEVKHAIKRLAERDLQGLYEEMPKNRILLNEITHKELLGARGVKVVVAGAAFNPIEDLISSGRSARSMGGEELARIKDLIVAHPDVFYYLGAFATTSWDPGCRTLLIGPNYLIALCDRIEDAWRTYWAPDTRWRGAARAFDLAGEEEKIEAVHRFVRRRPFALLMDEMTEDYVFEELGYAIPIIREAFERIAAEDPFVRFDTGARPYRLIRTYG
ncbi:MAG: hypothetical protein HY716_04400 [Planctomycetes bacterium]|nr:hypothetical protein [Planctomycetota bacterium]